MVDLQTYLKEKRDLIEKSLDHYLPVANVRPATLHKAMRYSVFCGGKRIRPAIMLAVGEAFGVSHRDLILPAIALEILHTYSLIHDDLPPMDDDDLRRGKATSHKVFGEANAILAGDALLTLSFEWLAESRAPAPYLPSQYVLEIAEAAGSRGMVAGQVEDLEAEGKIPSAELVDFIHVHKTAALFRAAARIGAIAGKASMEELDTLTLYGCNIGLAFQIADDILNVTSSEDELGKAVGSDTERGKMTYVAVHGLDEARARAQKLVDDAVDALHAIGRQTEMLEELARFITERTN